MTSPAEALAAKKPIKDHHQVKIGVLDCSIRELRQSMNLTLQEVVDATGVSIGSLCRIEMGSDLRESTAMKLAEFFNKPFSELWRPKPVDKRRKVS